MECDGHDTADFLAACATARLTHGRPTIIVARTVKGKGVSFMHDDFAWHSKPLSENDLARALAELDAADRAAVPGPASP